MRIILNVIPLVLVAAALLLASPPAFSQAPAAGETTLQASGAGAFATRAAETQPRESEKKRLAVNPLTGQTSAQGSSYVPLTPHERWQLYFTQSFSSPGAYTGPLFAALVLDQAMGQPKQWGGGFLGYGHRVVSRVASGDLVQNAFQFPVAALLKEDVRYITSSQHRYKRVEHAILFTFMTYNNQGHLTPNLANIGGYYVAAAASARWLPGRRNVAAYTFINGSEAIAVVMPINLLQEFWPEISRIMFHWK